MNIRVWSNFTKRQNSTLQPQASAGTQISCVLKEDTSIRNPSFILADPMPQITYVQAFGNYYFVTDIINIDAHRAEVACSIDVLATYRSYILGYTAFVERAASNFDYYINDPLLSGRQIVVNEDATMTSLSSLYNVAGCYIAQVFTKTRGITLYISNTLEIYRMILNPDCYRASDITQWVDKKIAQEFDLDVYIGSVKWVPFNISEIGTTTNELVVGPIGFDTTQSAWPSGTVLKYVNQNFIKVPDAITLETPTPLYNDFRDCSAQYTEYSIMLPGVGLVPLNTEAVGSCIHNNKNLQVEVMIDLVSCAVTYDISTYGNNERAYIAQFKGNIGVDVPIGKAHSDFMQGVGTIIATGQSMVNSGMQGAGGVPNMLFEGLKGSISAFNTFATTQTNIIGGSGNKADIYRHSANIYLIRRTYGSKSFPTTVAGRPLCQNVQLSTLSGFCQCGNASVPVNARDADRAEINAYLNSGFYIE